MKEKNALKVIYSRQTFRKGFRKWVLYSLLSLTRNRLLKMIELSANEDSIIVDMGCNIGYITRPLSLMTSSSIGIDVDSEKLRYAKKINRKTEFVCSDLCHLPLKKDSINMAVCASVFEHIENLEQALIEIKLTLHKQGKLVAGYPIETRLLAFIIKIFLKSESQVWQQHEIRKQDKHVLDPSIHKQSYSEIRRILNKHFSLAKRKKIPANCLPDSFSIYENAVLLKE